MITGLDQELFPDDCEVVSVPPHNMHIYLIQKNGSSSIRDEAYINDYPLTRNRDLAGIDSVDIFLREPRERYFSGVNTYVHYLLRDHPELDLDTCIFFANRYRFLNRHYLPQWHWLLNLVRFVGRDCQLKLHDISELYRITDFRTGSDIPRYDISRYCVDQSLDLWFLLDQVLLGYRGESMTWNQLKSIYQSHPYQPLRLITERFDEIKYVLS